MEREQSMETNMNDDDDRAELFIRLLAENERRLAAYVLTFIPAAADADDILQETKLALWRSFGQFEAGTNFGAWARRAAFNRILDFRKRKARESNRLVFSDNCLQHIADAFEEGVSEREDQANRLAHCLGKLSVDHRRILSLRYFNKLPIEQVADNMQRTTQATYRVLSRIRMVLRDCMMNKTHADLAKECSP